MRLSDLVTFHIALFMHKFHNKLLPSYLIASLIQYLVSIITIHEVQQINLITCLELEQTMEYLIFAYFFPMTCKSHFFIVIYSSVYVCVCLCVCYSGPNIVIYSV